jgi:hypothetical protein
MNAWLLASCCVAIAATSEGGLAAQASAAPFRVPFAIPVKVGDARLRDSSFVGDAMAYRYQGRQITGLDVYVWPLPTKSLGYTARDSLLQLEVEKFKATLPLGPERGWYDAYEIAFANPHPVALKDDSVEGYVVAYAFIRGSQQATSFFYIYALHGMYLKIRLTVPTDGWNTNPALDLPKAIVRAVAGS